MRGLLLPLFFCSKIYSTLTGKEGFLHDSSEPFSKRSRQQIIHVLFFHKETFTQALTALTAANRQSPETNFGGRQAPLPPRSEINRYLSATTFRTPRQAWAEEATAYHSSRSYKESTLLDIQVNFSFCPSQ